MRALWGDSAPIAASCWFNNVDKKFFFFFASDIAYCIVQSNFVCLLVLFNYGVDILLIWENSVLIDEKYGVNYYKL